MSKRFPIAMLKLLSIGIILLSGLSRCDAQTQLDSLIDNAPNYETYPEARWIILFDRTMIRIDNSGNKYQQWEILYKTRTVRDVNPLKIQTFRFNSDIEMFALESARIRTLSGEWIEVDSNSITVSTVPEVQWAAAYSNLKQFQISSPAIETGSALYLRYRLEPKLNNLSTVQSYAGGIELFGGYEPCLEKSVIIDIAANQSIQYETANQSFDPIIQKTDSTILYNWTMHDCSYIIPESHSVDLSFLVPRLVWTTFTDWQELGVFVSDPFWEKVDSSRNTIRRFSVITSPELQGIPALMHIANLIGAGFKTIPLRLGSIGFVPNSADRIWENRYGDCRDKAVLFTALARLYGYAPIPVLVMGQPAPMSELPVLEQFGNLILAVPTGDDTLWFDPAAESTQPGTLPYADTYGKGCMLLAGTPMLIDIPWNDPNSYGATNTFFLELSTNGELSGFVVCKPQGDLAAQARNLLDDRAGERDSMAVAFASKITADARVSGFTFSNIADYSEPVSVRMDFVAPGFGSRKHRKMRMEIPNSPFTFGQSGFLPISDEVRYPVALPGRMRIVTECVISIPEGYQVSILPPPLIIENPYVSIETNARLGEGTIRWSYVEQIKADSIPVEDYVTVRDSYRNLSLTKNRQIVFSKK